MVSVIIGADISGLSSGVNAAEQQLQDLARAGQNAGRDLSQAANAAARAQERASRSLERSIQRDIANLTAGGRSTRQYYETLIQQRGLDAQRFEEQLRRLDDIHRARQDDMSISDGQRRNAMRMLPAQFTDIVTQLAGGQNAGLIALQQGGQIRDSFGGFREAFAGIASVITPARLAIAGLAGGAVALGKALYDGAKESREFENAITLSGDSAGISAGQLQNLSIAIGVATSNYSASKEAMLALVKSGKVAAEDFGLVGKSIVLMSEATGKSVEDLVAEFDKIADDPVKAVVELSAKYQSMTADVYAQVQALIEQGKEQDAVRLIQQKYAEESTQMASKVAENLGWIEKGWKAVKDTAADAWDSMKGWGRDESLQEELLEAGKALNEYNLRVEAIRKKYGEAEAKSYRYFHREEEKRLNEHYLGLVGKARDEHNRIAKEKAEQEEREKSVKGADYLQKQADKYATKAAKKAKELEEAKKAYEAALKGATTKEAKEQVESNYRTSVAGINKKYEEKADGKYQLATTSAGLRLKAGAEYGGKAHSGTYAMAHALQGMLGTDLMRFGAFRDKYHIGKNSSHNWGLAFDATPNAKMSRAQMEAVPRKIKAYLAELGFSEKDFFVQFEHAGKRNKNGTVSTGNHWHFNWKNKEAANRFVQMGRLVKDFAKGGLYKEFDVSNKTPKKTDFELWQEQFANKQRREHVERELAASGKYRVTENELSLRSRPEYDKWTKEQQNSELAKARAADELATQKKLNAAADEYLAKLKQEQALLGKQSKLAQLQYEMDSGSMKHYPDDKKAEILAAQQAIDVKQKQLATDQEYSDLLDKLAEKTREQFDEKAFELSLVGKSKDEIAKLTLAREYDLHIMKAVADGASAVYVDALGQQKVAAEQARVEFTKLKQEHDDNWVAGISDGLVSYIGSFKSMREEVSVLVEQTTGRMADSLAEFVATGKGSFREFSQSVLEDISKMMMKMAIFNAMKAGAKAMSGAGAWVGAIGSAAFGAFWDGGYTGHGGKFEPAGIVHKGEYVLSQEKLRALGGVGAVEGLIHRAKGYSNGGLVGGGVNTVGLRAHAQASSASVINITVNVEGNNREEARQGAEEGVQAGLRKMISEIADSRIFEQCRPGNLIYNVAKA